MALITKIQKHAYILVAIIAIALLTFLFEYINPNLNALSAGEAYIGKVNGNTLKYDAYKTEYDEKEKELRAAKKGQNPSEQELDQIKSQIWGRFLVENVINKALDKLGLEVSPAEWIEVSTGANIDPNLQNIPAFKSQMGQFDPMLFKNFLKSLNQDEPGTPRGTRKKQWLEFEGQIKANRKISKFNALVENGMYVPKWLDNYDTKLFSTSADIRYVMLPMSTVDMEKIKFEHSELETYFESHKNKYIPDQPTVKISTVAFKLEPSRADSIAIMEKFNVRIEEMRAAKNDTNFFKAYGDKGYDLYFYKREELAENPAIEQVFSTPTGGIVGPYRTKDNVNAAKILGRRNISDSVLVLPMTISFTDVLQQSQAAVNNRLKLVDSIFKMLDTLHMEFAPIAAKYSADRGQAQPIWITRAEGTWNPEIFFFGSTRNYFKSPSDREGVVRILKVINFPGNKSAVQLGQISTPYVPSTETQNATYALATEFISKCKTASDIKKIAKNYPNVIQSFGNVTQNNNTIGNIEGNAREVVRWAFNSKSGDLSSMLQVGNNYVFCGNLGLRSKEHIELGDIEEDILPEFKRDKAFKMISEKLAGNSLQEVANKSKTTALDATGLNFQNPVIGQMPEISVIATALSLAPNKVSKPIQGYGGVYRIQAIKTYPSPLKPEDVLNMKTQLNQEMKSSQGLMDAMINNARMVDNRVNMY